MSKKRVILRTSAHDEEFYFEDRLRLIEVCRLLRVPLAAVSPFAESPSASRRLVGKYTPLSTLVDEDEAIILQFDRNINYVSMISDDHSTAEDPSAEVVAEYTFPSGHPGVQTHSYLTPTQCREFVAEAVADFVQRNPLVFASGARVVVGTSGGGDSNALISALATATNHIGVELLPAMLTGAPAWDAAVPRATALCASHGLTLHTLGREAINRSLGRKTQDGDWRSDFIKAFPTDDPEVIGTFAIRRTLSDYAKQIGAECVITGLNLEDILAETILRVVQGLQPLEFPLRHLDGTVFCYPVYRVPKKILDGCHPKYSLENYEQRAPGVMTGRAIPYYLAQSLNSLVPGVEFDLLDGFASMSHEKAQASSGFAFALLPGVDRPSEALVETWQKFIGQE